MASIQAIRILHKPFLDIMTKSELFSRALTNSNIFVTSLVSRLHYYSTNSTTHHDNDTIVLRSLLRMLQILHQYHSNPTLFVIDNNLYTVVQGFAQIEGQVLVHQIANKLLIDFQNNNLLTI